MKKIIWTDRVRSDVLCRVKERIILHTMKKRKANWIGHDFRRNCFLKYVFEGKIEGRIAVTRRRGRRREHLFVYFKEKRR